MYRLGMFFSLPTPRELSNSYDRNVLLMDWNLFIKVVVFDALKSIRQSYFCLSPGLWVVNNFLSGSCKSSPGNHFVDCLSNLSVSQSKVHAMCKQQNGIQVLNHACDSQLALKVLYVVGNDSNSFNLVKMLKVNGYTVFTSSNHNISDDDNTNGMLEEGRQKFEWYYSI
ncbi:hypothetical protein NC651_019460 [Populus alba x Populus x berolinensis]|nr:hypothetical protein NC651_019460 [Populus alba x Populus x berolinensis]